jgi:hypothetical protein
MEIDFAIKDNHYEPVVDFDYGAVDRGNPLTAEIESGHSADQIKDLASAMSRIIQWCWVNGYGNVRSDKLSFAHWLAFTAALRPDILGDASYQKLGKHLGVTRAWISKLAIQFQKDFGIHFRRSRRAGSQATFSQITKQNHETRKPSIDAEKKRIQREQLKRHSQARKAARSRD